MRAQFIRRAFGLSSAVLLALQVFSCSDDEGDCPDAAISCGDSCVDFSSDVNNCGSCGTACTTGESCRQGSCTCQVGLETCGEACVDVESNAEHCGGCGQACDAGTVCARGACVESCPDDLTACGRSCVDTGASAQHCGDCDTACEAGQLCSEGACGCAASETSCNNACVDLSRSLLNCGECGASCSGAEICVAGACTDSAEHVVDPSLGGDQDAGAGGQGGGQECAAQESATERTPVYVLFLLDESGSMGDGDPDRPEHDPEKKWIPITDSLRTFFEADASAGIFASLTLFGPNANKTDQPAKRDRHFDEEQVCSTATYETPDVSMKALPDNAFGQLIDSVTPPNEYGTPTRPALEGVLAQAQGLQAEHGEEAQIAIVVVTDGKPTQCNSNSIDNVAEIAESAAGKGIPVYAIGVGNVDGLKKIAEKGATEDPFIVAIEDPVETQRAFTEAIDEIRGAVASCELQVPAPPAGKEFNQATVRLQKTGEDAEDLVYNADCEGGDGWRYDNPEAPSLIELCEKECNVLKSDLGAKVNVVFGCGEVIDLY